MALETQATCFNDILQPLTLDASLNEEMMVSETLKGSKTKGWISQNKENVKPQVLAGAVEDLVGGRKSEAVDLGFLN